MSTLSNPEARFQTASLNDVRQMIEWAAQEGWNPGLEDAGAFWGTDEAGFFVARVADEMVAAISVVNHDARMAFLGLYLCKPEFRGQGIGFGLWNHALQHAGSRCVGLDGVTAQEENYVKSGFVRHGAIIRFEGTLPNAALGNARMVDLKRDYDRVFELDIQAIGYPRGKFLHQWLCQNCATRRTVVLGGTGAVTGFATVRQCREGVKIGPIIASDEPAAMTLLTAAASVFRAQKIIVDLPDNQHGFMTALSNLGFTSTFQTAHMFRGTPPEVSQTYRAAASMECG